jgi:FkbM family methyltransferase
VPDTALAPLGAVPAALRRRLGRALALVRALGVVPAVHFLRGHRSRAEAVVRPKQALHPLRVRSRSSDFDVLLQVFGYAEYACLADLHDVRLVVDCGANVGYSAAWFLTQFPDATVLAVEPDGDNFALLHRNLEPYGRRALAVRAGVWPECHPLRLSRRTYQDGREWTRQVEPCGAADGEFPGYDIPALLAMVRYPRISLLKVDIEGAETLVFGSASRDWIGRVDNIAIELHDDSPWGDAAAAFYAAIAGRPYEVSQWGELTICRS